MPHAATPGTATLCELFDRTVVACGPHLALRSEDGSVTLTWKEFGACARAAAAGLAGVGIGPGDTVACWLRDRPELHIVGVGAVLIGAVPFAPHCMHTVGHVEHALADAGSRVLVTEPCFFRAALSMRKARRTALEMIVLVAGADARALTWAELLDCAPADFDADAVARAMGPDDLATLIYERGASSSPTGLRLTHRDVLSLRAMHDAVFGG
jgi:acyl-coenzyme A synthetase/AMP-(fatty) acid ligase